MSKQIRDALQRVTQRPCYCDTGQRPCLSCAAGAALASLPRKSKEKPTILGFYWVKRRHDTRSPAHSGIDGGRQVVRICGNPGELIVMCTVNLDSDLSETIWDGAEWQGPLEPETEAGEST